MKIHQVIDKLGRKAIADCIGVTPNAVTEARRAGKFPALWYDALTKLGDAEGVTVPRYLFRFKSAITLHDSPSPSTQRENAVRGE